MALPLGKKTLAQIARRADPQRRVVELATLLEWLLRLGKPSSNFTGTTLADVVRAYIGNPDILSQLLSAIEVRNRVVHCVPGSDPATKDEVRQAAKTLTAAVHSLLENKLASDSRAEEALKDPLGEFASDADGITEAAGAPGAAALVRGALCRLDLVSGFRAPFDTEAMSQTQLAHCLTRHYRQLTDVPADAVQRALAEEAPGKDSCLSSALSNLQRGYESLAAFDGEWVLAPGAPPMAAVALEPDIQMRIRLLATLVEHLLAWVSPTIDSERCQQLLAAGGVALLEALLDTKSHLVPDPELLVSAWSVRDRLVRVVPEDRPVTIRELHDAEATLWRSAYELRRHCHIEHADALVGFADAPLGTLPNTALSEIASPQSQLAELLRRVNALATDYERLHPGNWSSPSIGRCHPVAAQRLRNHSSASILEQLPAIDGAQRYLDRRTENGSLLKPFTAPPEFPDWQQSLYFVIDQLEQETGWKELPETTYPKRRKQPPPPQAPARRAETVGSASTTPPSPPPIPPTARQTTPHRREPVKPKGLFGRLLSKVKDLFG